MPLKHEEYFNILIVDKTILPSEKNGSVDVTLTCVITHQKHLVQSGRSTWSAVDNFNTLRIFTKEPIREQDAKLECMNQFQWFEILSSHNFKIKSTIYFISNVTHVFCFKKLIFKTDKCCCTSLETYTLLKNVLPNLPF